MRGLSARLTGQARLLLLIAGLGLLLGAWVMANQPWFGPDETEHFLRAYDISEGHLLGPKVPYTTPGLTPPMKKFIDSDTTGVPVPGPEWAPPGITCTNGQANVHGCLMEDDNGNFPPLAYLLPAVAVKPARDAGTGIWLMRGAAALQSLVFLILAVALLWNGSGFSVLGLLAAISPMVLFTSSIMNSSGLGISSSLAFSAAVLRLTRAPARAPRGVFIAIAVSGAAAILSGPIGLIFALGSLSLGVALLRRSGLRELGTQPRRRLRGVVFALLGAIAVSLIYRRASGISPLLFGVTPIFHAIHLGLIQFPQVVRQSVGTFASLTIPLPLRADQLYWAAILALVLGALVVGGRADRWVVLATTALALAFPILFYAWVDRFTGFGLEGREILPMLTLIPLAAGEVVFRRLDSPAPARSVAAVSGAALAFFVGFQAYAWWYNARGEAEVSRLPFLTHAYWSPPLGWAVWLVIAGAGVILMMAFALSCWLASPRAPSRRAAVLVS